MNKNALDAEMRRRRSYTFFRRCDECGGSATEALKKTVPAKQASAHVATHYSGKHSGWPE